MQSHSKLQNDLEELQEEHRAEKERAQRSQEMLVESEQELEMTTSRMQAQAAQLKDLQDQILAGTKNQRNSLGDRDRQIAELQSALDASLAQHESAARDKTTAIARLGAVEEKANTRQQEIEKLRQRVHELESESADKEVKLLQLKKDVAAAREDCDSFNIALDSKQQELDFVSGTYDPALALLYTHSFPFSDEASGRRERDRRYDPGSESNCQGTEKFKLVRLEFEAGCGRTACQ